MSAFLPLLLLSQVAVPEGQFEAARVPKDERVERAIIVTQRHRKADFAKPVLKGADLVAIETRGYRLYRKGALWLAIDLQVVASNRAVRRGQLMMFLAKRNGQSTRVRDLPPSLRHAVISEVGGRFQGGTPSQLEQAEIGFVVTGRYDVHRQGKADFRLGKREPVLPETVAGLDLPPLPPDEATSETPRDTEVRMFEPGIDNSDVLALWRKLDPVFLTDMTAISKGVGASASALAAKGQRTLQSQLGLAGVGERQRWGSLSPTAQEAIRKNGYGETDLSDASVELRPGMSFFELKWPGTSVNIEVRAF